MLPAIEEQARVLRASSRRPVSLQGAYLERVVVNLMGGRGETDVFLDDLEVGPVPPELAGLGGGRCAGPILARSRPRAHSAEKGRPAGTRSRATSALPPSSSPGGVFEKLEGERRYVPGSPRRSTRRAPIPVALRRQASMSWSPTTSPTPRAPARPSRRDVPPAAAVGRDRGRRDERVLPADRRLPACPGAVLLWSIGDHLGQPARGRRAQVQEVEQGPRRARGHARERRGTALATATVDGEFRLYARSPSNLDVIGHRPARLGHLAIDHGRLHYLIQRRDLTARSNPEALFWAWLPATTPPGSCGTSGARRRAALGDAAGPARAAPAHDVHGPGRRVPRPDLRRRCRPDPAGRRSRCCIEMSFLNAEIDLFEEILARNIKQIAEYEVLDPDPPERPTTANVNQKRMPLIDEQARKPGLHAAAIPLEDGKGSLLLVADFAGDAQWQPPQMAYHDLVITPACPRASSSWRSAPAMPGSSNRKSTIGPRRDADHAPRLRHVHDPPLHDRHGPVRAHPATTSGDPAEWPPDGHPPGRDPVRRRSREIHERLKADGHLINNEDESRSAEAGHRGQADRCRRTDGPGRGVHQERPQGPGGPGLRHRLGRGPTGQPAAAHFDVRLLGAGHGRVAEGVDGELQRSQDRICNPGRSGRTPSLRSSSRRSAARPPSRSIPCPNCTSGRTGPRGSPATASGQPRPVGLIRRSRLRSCRRAGSDVSHQYDRIVKKIRSRAGSGTVWRKKKKNNDPEERHGQVQEDRDRVRAGVLRPGRSRSMLTVEAEDPEEIDKLDPILDYPVAAIRSPSIRVAANNLIRISVLVRRPMHSLLGKGGVIIHDSIGGDPFQFRPVTTLPRLFPRRPLPQGAGRRDLPRHSRARGFRRGLLRRFPRPGDGANRPNPRSGPGAGPATSAGGRFTTTAGPPSAGRHRDPGLGHAPGPGDLDRTAPNSSTHAPLGVGSRPRYSRNRGIRALPSSFSVFLMDPPPTRALAIGWRPPGTVIR